MIIDFYQIGVIVDLYTKTQAIGRKKGSEATVSVSVSKLLTSVRKVLGHIKSAKDSLKSI